MKLSSSKRKISIIIICLLFILSLNFFQKEVRGFFYSISGPLQKSLWEKGGGASNFLGAVFESQNLKRENKNLNLKIQNLLSDQNYMRELEGENKILREALEIGLQKEFRLELVKVISKNTDRDAVLIDRGLEYGLSKGLPLITSQKVLIGNIAEVYPNYSKVLLISDKESSFEAKISSSNVSGLIKGLGRFRILLDLLPKDKEIKKGDLVVSIDGFLVGLIKEINKVDVKPFQEAEVSPFFNISDLDKVFIVLN